MEEFIWKLTQAARLQLKKTFGYLEANEEKRKAFEAQISNIKPHSLVFVDESGVRLIYAKSEVGVARVSGCMRKRVVNVNNASMLWEL